MKNSVLFLIYFLLSTVLTWWFVIVCPLYVSTDQMLLSTSIAGGKWAIQILLAMLILKEKAGTFLKGIGFVCFAGSCILIPFILLAETGITDSGDFFLGSLMACVITMIFLYYYVVKKNKLSIRWWLAWLLCLAVAISLQLTVVFHVITF